MKAVEQYFPVVLFITLYRMVLTFESVDKILKCDHVPVIIKIMKPAPVNTTGPCISINCRIGSSVSLDKVFSDIPPETCDN